MEYLLELRKLVGHRPLLMIGAAALIVDEKNRLLLMKRSDSSCWGPPGGAVELGEVVETAARREVREETGLELGGLALFGVFSGPDLFYRYPNGDEVYNVTIVYLTRDWRGEVRLNGEHTNWGWFAPEDVPENISPPIKPVIGQFIETIHK
ncbi:MAG: NUDIX domain-containing protein [Chloroflexi bacterium]|jgi:ADP-ribose pyrophosphatase YjhB (NUDIX family)|nr:NUDIX domain-containing protein [Chloroflexota bacterium]